MLLLMKRTQATVIGKFDRGLAYDFDLGDHRQKTVADDLVKREMAEETTLEKLKKMAANAAKIDLPATAKTDPKSAAEKLLSDAKADADKIRDDAKGDAEKLLSDAKADAKKSKADK